MVSIVECLLLIPILWLVSFAAYLLFNHGLAPNRRRQQFFRYLVASVVTVVPLAVTATSPFQPIMVFFLGAWLLWTVTYPLCYHLTYRKSSPDYDHQIDGAFGIYLFGWLSGLSLLPYSNFFMGALLLVLLFLPFAQWVYYVMYRCVIDVNGMLLIQNTDYNEVIEFARSYSILKLLGVVSLLLLLDVSCIAASLYWPLAIGSGDWWRMAIGFGDVLFLTFYLWKPARGLFVRTGIMQLYQTVREYQAKNSRYVGELQKRISSLHVQSLSVLNKPHTVLLVIGESASRQYMSAFATMPEHTTPWLEELSRDSLHCTLFPNAYSCDIQTVPTLERALTELNQYDGGEFFSSCSIVDIAQRLGYRVSWFSNQGQIGAADTPITLVADTANVAKWTQQEIGKHQYDEALIDFLSELNPQENNLVVFHLMGSHFNYENRFTEEARQWGDATDHDRITNYKNSLYYTDLVLHRAFDYCREHLNLQTMVYFSDHAEVPNRHRQPGFDGFGYLRIPLMVWIGDEYIKARPQRAKVLKRNQNRYWTNDLLYELMCGLFDAESNHYRDVNSLASDNYRFQCEELTAMNGRICISEDDLKTKKTI